MKRLSQTLFFLILSVSTVCAQKNDFYSKHWSNVYRYEIKGLPQSALAVVDSIYTVAKRDNNLQELTKALLYQSKFALSTQENAEQSVIKKFTQEIKASKAPLKNLLESLLANIYWQYFKENRWKYYGRSRTSKTINEEDFRTWDADAMFNAIHHHFQNSLEGAVSLQKIQLESINEILIQADHSKMYRPTLYDFLIHNAIDFYSTDESTITRPLNEFKINDEKYFLDFENADVQSADTLSPLAHALVLYRDLLSFHKVRADTTAYVNLELERLNLVADHSDIDPSRTIRIKALQTLRENYRSHPASTLVTFELASVLHKDGSEYSSDKNIDNQFRIAEALNLCNEAISLFPNSDGAKKCNGLREAILHKHLSLVSEKYIPAEKPSFVSIKYTNIDTLYFDVFRISREVDERLNGYIEADSILRSQIAVLSPDLQWSVKLKNVHDYQSHTTEVVVPALGLGRYLITATLHDDDSLHRDVFGYVTIQVTDLGMLEYASKDEHHYRVVNRNNGKPVAGADIHLLSTYGRDISPQVDEHLTTGKDGEATLRKRAQFASAIRATVRHENDEASFGHYYMYPSRDKERKDEYTRARTFLFTDRSIYRPGQVIFFKGILIKTNTSKSAVVQGQHVIVSLDDVNGKEIGSLRLKTNAYGSFSGEFKLPPGGLTGEYTLYADEDDEDSKFYDDLDDFEYTEHTVSVEEYKRPTFEVTFKPVTQTFTLRDTVKVTGVAEAYSGSQVSGSKVVYKVTRKVQYPRWYYWTFDRTSHDAAEIAHGETVTNNRGEFSIAFKAIPDEDVSPEDKPVFVYEIKADITDINGETRSATADVKVGYHAVTATINAPANIDLRTPDNVIGITTENLNGQFVPLKGEVQIFKLRAPDAPMRTRPWEAPDLPLLTQQEFQKLFPHDAYSGSTEPKTWPTQELLLELPFDTHSSTQLKYRTQANWPLGYYRIQLNAVDSVGQVVNDFYYFNVTDSRSKAVPDNSLLIFELDKPVYKVGDVARLKVGSAAADITFYIHVEKNYDVTKTYVEHFSSNTKEILLPITDEKEHGFSVSCSGAAYNSFVYRTINVQVVSTSNEFEIETITFKDKLQAGAKETWSFSIKGGDSAPMEAEVLASMYDASLDQFKSHQWSFQPTERSPYFARISINGNQSFHEQHFNVRNLEYGPPFRDYQHYDRFDWFGFSFTRNSYVQGAYLDRLYSSGAAADVPSRVMIRNQKHAKAGFIYGRIVDNEGQPLPGVNIVISGTTIGTSTDMDGNYAIAADKNDVLIYSFVGYARAEARVGRKNTIDVIMEPDITELSEVVVTAYGIQTKKAALAAAIANVEVESTGEIVFEEPLEGLIPGVGIESRGKFYAMSIRGASSTSAESKPLYVVDGVIVDASRIDEADLAGIQVLNGSAATALYGARATNGVIIITTKSAQKKMDEELAKVSARKNFNETAFFFPHLFTNEDGKIQFTFTTPESLTRWRLQLLAHTKDLVTTTKTLQTVTQKELMVTPNIPRFLRIGDEVSFSVKVANLSRKKLNGKVGLQLTDAVTGKNIDILMANTVRNKTFVVNAQANTEVSWTLKVPDGINALQYRVVAKAGNFSDGEQNALPVLSNRTLVTETMPLFVRSSQTKTLHLDKLEHSKSTTLKHHRLTLEITSNPAWYAVQSLPYLMEFPHECAEQLFSRYYANALATHIIEANPVIREVFDEWSSKGSLVSNLEKNPELKSMIIEETPWLRDAQDEQEQKKRLSLLFDLNTMRHEMTSVLNKIKQMQFAGGGFPWFSGSRYPNRYITQHIAVTYGHLKKLQIPDYADERNMIMSAVWYLDQEFVRDYEALLNQAKRASSKGKNESDKKRLTEEHLSMKHVADNVIHYLYMRSFFQDVMPGEQLRKAMDYYEKQSALFWQDFNLYSKGMIALVQHRSGNTQLAKDILRSLEENAIKSEELGMYWKENTGGMYWYQADIETQALVIEAFSEILASGNDSDGETRKTIDELRLWLLKNKQTTRWKTTKATTVAVYAILMNGTGWLTLDDAVDVTVGTIKLTPDPQDQPEVATGYFKASWAGETITPAMGTVTFSKKGEGVAWGGLYWQYFEDLDKVTAAETPLKLTKNIFVVTDTDRGELLTDISKADLKPGDRIRVRIELTSDRPMEFLHMKDMRAAGLEPVDVLSGYKYQENLGYYQSTKDASTNFFFDVVPKGIYVFEYDLRVSNKGDFSNGITTIQSMYAPEFTSHSEGVRVEVR